MTKNDLEHIAKTLLEENEARDRWTGLAKLGPDARLARRMAARRIRSGQDLLTVAAAIEEFDAQLAADLREDAR